MKIGELAKRTGCPVETIRYYEREGLLPEPARSEGNYRQYTLAHVERLSFIRHCRSLDMTQDEITIFCTALSERLQEKHIQEKMPDVPYLATFLYAWRDIAGEQTVAQWISGVDQSDRDFLKMLLNLRTAVSSSNQGDYLRLDLDVIGTVFGITGLMERFEDIKARQEASLTGMISGIEDAILQIGRAHV